MWTKIRDIWKNLPPELKNTFLQLILWAFSGDAPRSASPEDDAAREELRAECPTEVEAIEEAL